MAYVPPKGKCNYKTSLMSPACPCLRFMLHPVKAATSFECDGCAHHASFHSLENPAEDAIIAKWKEQDVIEGRSKQAIGGVRNTKKRKMIAEKAAGEDEIFGQIIELDDDGEVDVAEEEIFARSTKRKRAPATSKVTKGR